jgi:hypothetical protein
MKKLASLFALFLLIALSAQAQAWVRAGFRGHFRGPRVGVFIGPSPWWYDPYWAYDPYPYYAPTYPAYPYYPYPYYPAYPPPAYSPATTPEPAASAPASSPDSARRDLRYTTAMISHARDAVKFEFQDGDVSRQQYEAATRNIDAVDREAQAEAAEGGGTITGDQERALWNALKNGTPPERLATAAIAESNRPTPVAKNEPPRYELRTIDGQIARLRAALNKKSAAGDITPAQRDAENDYLTQLEKVAQAQARAGGGKLSDAQETALRSELLRVDSAIQRNLVIH